MIFEKVKSILVDTLSMDEDTITLEANIKDDLGIDSLDAVELSMALEEEYGLTIPQEDLEQFTTVQSIVSYIEKNVQ